MGLDSTENGINLIIPKYDKELILRNNQIERREEHAVQNKIKKLVLLICGRKTTRVTPPKKIIQLDVNDLEESRLSYGAIQWLRKL